MPAQTSTGSPAKVSEAADAPGLIVGHVPIIFGRYCADGLSPPPPLLDPDPELDDTLASVTSSPLPLELDEACEPELPLVPDEECEPELPLDPELPPELELGLSEPPELVDPELLSEPEELPPELDSEPGPVSIVGDTAQLAMSEKPVTAKLKTTVQRIAILRCGAGNRVRRTAPGLKLAAEQRSTQLTTII